MNNTTKAKYDMAEKMLKILFISSMKTDLVQS